MPQRHVVVFSAHWAFSIFELNIPFKSHDTTFASWHIFKCHNALWLFENSHNTTFRVMAVSLMPQRVVVVFSAHWAFSIFERNIYTGCNRRNGPNFGRVFLRSNYTDITQNTYIQSSMVMEILAREVWNFDSYYSLIDYQIHIETGRNMWFL